MHSNMIDLNVWEGTASLQDCRTLLNFCKEPVMPVKNKMNIFIPYFEKAFRATNNFNHHTQSEYQEDNIIKILKSHILPYL